MMRASIGSARLLGRIEVEDAPFIITALASIGQNRERDITVTDNLGREYKMTEDTPLLFKT